jgi:hypothetical protein
LILFPLFIFEKKKFVNLFKTKNKNKNKKKTYIYLQREQVNLYKNKQPKNGQTKDKKAVLIETNKQANGRFLSRFPQTICLFNFYFIFFFSISIFE